MNLPARISALLPALIVSAVGTTSAHAAGTISTVVGTGVEGSSGDGGPAGLAQLNNPKDVVPLPDGGYLVADTENRIVRRVSATGVITRVAGTGVKVSSVDGGLATMSGLQSPTSVSPTADGGFLIADRADDRVRRVSPSGFISTVAGTGSLIGDDDDEDDGGSSSGSELDRPRDAVELADGSVLIADTDNDRIVRVAPGGAKTTVAGTGSDGFSGDGGPATSAKIKKPTDIAPTADGGFLFVDSSNKRIRRVTPGGTISTVAGGAAAGAPLGDGGQATSASLSDPIGVAVLPDGGYLVVDRGTDRIRRVAPNGVITTDAGTGVAGASGDGGPSTSAQLKDPYDVGIAAGGYYIADEGNHKVRFVAIPPTDSIAPERPTLTATDPGSPANDNSPRVRGAGEAGSTVRLYTSADCTGAPAATGTAVAFSSPGLTVSVPDDSSVIVRATATDAAGNTSPCSTSSITYLEDSTGLPGAPGALGASGPDAPDATSTPDAAGIPVAPDGPDAGQPISNSNVKPEPRIGQTVVLAATKGRVLVKVPGKGKRFVALSAADDVPVGSTIDTRKGTVSLSSALNAKGATQTGTFYGGLFIVRQSKKERGFTRLTLTGGDFSSCSRKASASSTTATASRRGSRRRLWGRDRRGRFGTNGRNSAATVRGTQWLTEDSCAGTLTRVVKGAVEVYDRVAKKRVLVRAGKSYLARSRR